MMQMASNFVPSNVETGCKKTWLIHWMGSWVSLTSFLRKWYAYHGSRFDQRNGATTSNIDDPPHPRWHRNQAASTVTTQNLRLITTKTQIATCMSHSSKPRPKPPLAPPLSQSWPKAIAYLNQSVGDERDN